MKKLSLNQQLSALVFIALIFTTTIAIGISVYQSRSALMEAGYHKLTAGIEIKKTQILNYFSEKQVDISALSRSSEVRLVSYRLMMQHALAGFPEGAHSSHTKEHLAMTVSEQDEEFFQGYVNDYGYDDIYLVDKEHGHVLYSVKKKSDYGTMLSDGPLRESELAHTWKDVVASEEITVSDVSLYAPGDRKPTLFIGAPVYYENRFTAVLIFRLGTEKINAIMTQRSGLGGSEEYYLVGNDKLLRSDTYLGTSRQTVTGSFAEPEEGIIDTQASRGGLANRSGAELITDYRGVEVLSSFTPLSLGENIRWVLIAEIDENEIMAVPNKIKYAILLSMLLVLPAVFLMVYLIIKKSLIQPIERFKGTIVSITKDPRPGRRIGTDISPELNDVATSFNALLATLEQAQSDLRQSAFYLKKGQEVARLGVWNFNHETQQFYWSDETHHIFGTDPASFQPNYDTFMQRIHPDERTFVDTVFRDSLRKQVDCHAEHRIVLDDGSVRYVEERSSHTYDDNAQPINSIGAVMDITERKMLENSLKELNETLEQKVLEKTEALQGSLNEFEQLFNTTIESIFMMENGAFININEEAVRTFGYDTKEEMLRLGVSDLAAEESRDLITSKMTQHNPPIYEAQLRHCDGTTFPALIKGHDFKVKSRELRIFAVLDISELKEKERHMLQQSRQAQMGEMLAMIAHQWRQPLASISTTAVALQLKIMHDNYQKEFFEKQLQNISDFSQHLSGTINDFRDFFKEQKQKSRISLKNAIDSALDIISASLTYKNIALEVSHETDKETFTHTNELKQVILNLIKNAEDILLEKIPANPTIRIRGYEQGSYLCLAIGDNGGGIPEEIKEKIFDPYFTTKEALNGTGLGLYMSRIIIEEHCRGRITADNTDGGALFTISLPILTDEQE